MKKRKSQQSTLVADAREAEATGDCAAARVAYESALR